MMLLVTDNHANNTDRKIFFFCNKYEWHRMNLPKYENDQKKLCKVSLLH